LARLKFFSFPLAPSLKSLPITDLYKQIQKLDSTTNVIPMCSPCMKKEYVNRYEVHINIDIYCRYRCICVCVHVCTHTHTHIKCRYVCTYKRAYQQNIKYIQYTLHAVVHYVHIYIYTHTHTHTIYQHISFPLKFITFHIISVQNLGSYQVHNFSQNMPAQYRMGSCLGDSNNTCYS